MVSVKIGESNADNASGSTNSFDAITRLARNNLQLYEKVLENPFPSFYDKVKERTQCSLPALYDLFLSVMHVNATRIPGDFLEVGCWQGGSLGLALLSDVSESRRVIGFDTFQGHYEPPSYEIDIRGQNMRERSKQLQEKGQAWNKADFDECRKFLHEMANDDSRVLLIPGDIKETAYDLPSQSISILRIDCDWYLESLVSLEVFWPMLSNGGFLLLDDYGHHPGQKKAVQEYFANKSVKITHVDYSCVSIMKLS